MPIDPSIALNANAPKPTNPLQTALQVAQYRYMNTNSQAAQQGLDANRATSAAYQQATDPTTGVVDNNKLVGILSQNPDAAYNLPQVIQGINTQKQQQQTLQRGSVGLDTDQLANAQAHLGWAYQTASAVANNPNASTDDVFNALSQSVKNGQITPQIASQAIADMPGAGAPKGALQAWAANHVAQAAGAAQQLGVALPKPTQIDTGGSLQYKDTNPLTNPGIIGTNITKTLDPGTATTPTAGYDSATGTPVNMTRAQFIQQSGGGGQPPPIPSVPMPANMPSGNGQAAPMPAGPAPGLPNGVRPAMGVASGPSMGVAGSNDGNVATVNTHWGQLNNDANAAQTNIGLAQNIKAYASKAATGKQGDKLAAANGLLSVFGVGGQTDLNTATDLLQKNMARLSLSSRSAAGGTDAAGALATAANPHGSMTMTAIKDAADQVIGSQQMALSEQKLLQPFKLKNDVAGYQQAQTQFNQAADPRIWQFQNMDPQQRQAFKAGLSPADQQSFGQKIRTLESLGAIK